MKIAARTYQGALSTELNKMGELYVIVMSYYFSSDFFLE